jgi:hypothetical protein
LEAAALCSRTLAGHLRAFMLYRGGRIAGRRGRAAAFLRTGAGICGIRAAGSKRRRGRVARFLVGDLDVVARQHGEFEI